MRAFKVTITISGMNEHPEKRSERIVAPSFEDAVGLAERTIRGASFVPLELNVIEMPNQAFTTPDKQ